jgi:hypothetical protein
MTLAPAAASGRRGGRGRVNMRKVTYSVAILK